MIFVLDNRSHSCLVLKGGFALCCDGIIIVLGVFAYLSSSFLFSHAMTKGYAGSSLLVAALRYSLFFVFIYFGANYCTTIIAVRVAYVGSIKVLHSLSTKQQGESLHGRHGFK
jgi:hypothetical protein